MSVRTPATLLVLVLLVLGAWWMSRDARLREASPTALAANPAARDSISGEPVPVSDAVRSEAARSENSPESGEVAPATLLVVRLIEKQSRAPLPEVSCQLATDSGSIAGCVDGAGNPIEGACESPADGRVSFRPPAGEPLELRLAQRSEPWARARLSIEPLALGERRELDVELSTANDLEFVCRVVADEDGRVIAFAGGARLYQSPVEPYEEHSMPVEADGEGLLHLSAPSWIDSTLVIDVPGFALGVTSLVAGHETLERAFVLRLARGASMQVTVRDPLGAVVPHVLVRAELEVQELSQTDLWFDFADGAPTTIEATTDPHGVARLERLPPRVRFRLRLLRDGALALKSEIEWRLEPGEQASTELVLGRPARVFGVVLDQADRPVADLQLWRAVPVPSQGNVFRPGSQPVARAKSDAQGRFEFQDVPTGAWLIGPRGPNYTVLPAESLAPYATRVEVTSAGLDVELTLRVWRGLFLRGQVVLPDGAPASRCNVTANAKDLHLSGYLWTASRADGTFELGPLADTPYELAAGGPFSGEFASSEPLITRPADGLRLVVTRAATISGRLLDEQGQAEGEFEISLLGLHTPDGATYTMGNHGQEGRFHFSGVAPGEWDLYALARGGRVARARLSVAAGEQRELDLRLEPAATLVLCNGSQDDFWYFAPRVDGLLLPMRGPQAGDEEQLQIPPGRIEVRILDPQMKFIASRTFEARAGETVTCAWPDD